MTDLPPGWGMATIDEIAGGIRSNVVIGPFGSSLKVSDYRDSGVPLIFVRNIRSHDFSPSVSRFVGVEKARELRSHEALPGDVLITKMGDPPGDATVYRGRGPAVITADCIRLRTSNDFLAEYVAFAFGAEIIRRQIATITRGVAQKKVSLSRFRQEVHIPAPAFEEQCRIVNILEDHLSRLDAAGGLLIRVERQCAALRRSMLRNVIYDPNRRTGQLRELVDRIEAGKSFGGAAAPATAEQWGIIKVSAMTWGEFRPDENKAVPVGTVNPCYEIRPGDLLVSRANTADYVGASVLVGDVRPRLLLSDKSLRLVLRGQVDARWLWLALSSPDARKQISAKATGTKDSMRNISQSALMSIEVPDVPFSQQQADVVRLTTYFDAMKTLTESVNAAHQRQRALRRALLDAAFSGRLTGRSSDMDLVEEMAGV